MNQFREASRRLWVRMTLVAIAGLFVTLIVVMGAVYQLTIFNERNEIDALLAREGNAVAAQLNLEVTSLSTNKDVIEMNNLETIASRALALHPGSSVHMTLVRVGEEILSTARGPLRIEQLRDTNQLPAVTPGVLESRKGIRTRSQEIALQNLVVTVETITDDQAIVDNARTIAGRVLIAALIGGVIGTIGLAFAVRASTKQLDEVSDTVRQTRLDNLSARVTKTNGTGEIAVLSRDVNEMLEELSQARALRDELIASVSHELRTPLAAARGHMDLLRLGRTSDPEVSIARIDRELIRMTRLVDDLLALYRAADPAWLSVRLVNTQSILTSLSERVAAFDSPNIEIKKAPDIMIEVDADRILQALSNLVRNSILHNPPNTSVVVSSQVRDTNIELIVEDTGIGIPQSVLENFGEAFVRGSEAGTGLGLAVTRAVAIAHSGSLNVQSDQLGTKVTLVIPIEK